MKWSTRVLQPSEPARIRQILSNANILALLEKGPIRPKALVAKLHPSHVGIRFHRLTKSLAKEFHAASVRMVLFTVNERSEMERVVDMRLDGIISDYPDLLNGTCRLMSTFNNGAFDY